MAMLVLMIASIHLLAVLILLIALLQIFAQSQLVMQVAVLILQRTVMTATLAPLTHATLVLELAFTPLLCVLAILVVLELVILKLLNVLLIQNVIQAQTVMTEIQLTSELAHQLVVNLLLIQITKSPHKVVSLNLQLEFCK